MSHGFVPTLLTPVDIISVNWGETWIFYPLTSTSPLNLNWRLVSQTTMRKETEGKDSGFILIRAKVHIHPIQMIYIQISASCFGWHATSIKQRCCNIQLECWRLRSDSKDPKKETLRIELNWSQKFEDLDMMKSLFPSSAECECWWEHIKCAQHRAVRTR